MSPDTPKMPETPETPEPNRSGTTRSKTQGESGPRLPHEHDESSDSGTSEPRAVIRRAHHDVASGQVDTDRGAVTDDVYRRTLRDVPKKR